MRVDLVCKAGNININCRGLLADLILWDMSSFDVILGMEWLAAYHANVDCVS